MLAAMAAALMAGFVPGPGRRREERPAPRRASYWRRLAG